MKYLFTYWLVLMLLPMCITTISLDNWMPEASLQEKPLKQESKQELMMNPIFIFK